MALVFNLEAGEALDITGAARVTLREKSGRRAKVVVEPVDEATTVTLQPAPGSGLTLRTEGGGGLSLPLTLKAQASRTLD